MMLCWFILHAHIFICLHIVVLILGPSGDCHGRSLLGNTTTVNMVKWKLYLLIALALPCPFEFMRVQLGNDAPLTIIYAPTIAPL